MGVQASKATGWQERLMAELKRGGKKTVVLGLLLLLLAILVCREVFRRLGPSDVGAIVPRRARAVEAATAVSPASPNKPPKRSERPGKVASLAKPVVDRDLFAPNPSYFPPHQRQNKQAPVVTPVDRAAAKREAERRAVQAQAQALVLQSTVVGTMPTAIINGQVLHEGDWINGFRVIEITSRACVIERKGMRVTLEMSN